MLLFDGISEAGARDSDSESEPEPKPGNLIKSTKVEKNDENVCKLSLSAQK